MYVHICSKGGHREAEQSRAQGVGLIQGRQSFFQDFLNASLSCHILAVHKFTSFFHSLIQIFEYVKYIIIAHSSLKLCSRVWKKFPTFFAKPS